MIIKTLVENTTKSSQYRCHHGLSLYIETSKHKIMFDVGEDDLFLENAMKMGVDISAIDILVISHGHNDHGGALRLFLQNNKLAKVYVRESAFEKHYSQREELKDISLDNSLYHNERFVWTDNLTYIDDELLLFSNVHAKNENHANRTLFKKVNGQLQLDDFVHEQSLIIKEKEKNILISGCSHSGICEIIQKAEKIIHQKVDTVIGGFHLQKPSTQKDENKEDIQEVAKQLKSFDAYYYTCHCTGINPYQILKSELKDRISYLSTGDIIYIGKDEPYL